MQNHIWVRAVVTSLVIGGLQGWAAIAQPAPLLQEEGVLQDGDAVLRSDGSLYDQYTFEGEAGQSVTINLQSDEFDTYLALLSPEQQVVAENDNVDQNDRNSSITITLPTNGTYTVIANGFDSTSRGEYSLEVTINNGEEDS